MADGVLPCLRQLMNEVVFNLGSSTTTFPGFANINSAYEGPLAIRILSEPVFIAGTFWSTKSERDGRDSGLAVGNPLQLGDSNAVAFRPLTFCR
jgi:hypothetical protein